MCDPFEFEKCTVCLHAFDIDLISSILRILKVEIVRTFIIKYLSCVFPCFIHRFRDMYPFLLRKLEVDITELWSLMPDTRTVSICDEVCMVYLMVFLSMLLIIILWKWWNISESDELSAFEFTNNGIFSFSLEYCLYTILRDDKLLIIIFH